MLSAIQGTLERRLEESAGGRVVIGVCGGSGSGKTVMASVLGYALNRAGIGAYIMSGDNYPRRIPAANDAERLRLFRMGGLRGMLTSGEYVDIPIYLNSTPMQTLEHRRLRNRDAQTDSAFTTMVLNIEQRKLDSQAWKAQVILSREGKKITYSAYRRETE